MPVTRPSNLITALTLSTGVVLWQLDNYTAAAKAPVIGEDHTLYVLHVDYYLSVYALNPMDLSNECGGSVKPRD